MNLFWMISVIVIYLGVIAYLGYKGYKDTKNASDYMVGGRSVHPYIMAMSYGATFISTAAIVGFGGIASMFGLSLMWLVFFNIFIGIFIAFVFLGKRTRMMGLNIEAHTFPEFLGRRLNSRPIQLFTGLFIFLSMPIYTAAVLIGASRIMEGMLNIPYIYSVTIFTIIVAAYVIMGGIKGVMYTDALQGTLMFGGMLILLVAVYLNLGGVIHSHETLTNLVAKMPEGLIKSGSTGWTSSPVAGSKLWWTIFTSLVCGVSIGVLAQPQLVVRFMTVKSNKEINRAVLIGGVFIFVTVGTPYIVGALSNVYFFNNFGKIAMEMADGNPDKVIPLFINSAMPSWFACVFMLVILSAAMSTLSSLFHSIGTSVGRDIYEYGIMNGKTKAGSVIITKVGIILSILFTVFLALRLPGGIIARATAFFFGLMASSYLAPYFLSLYWRRFTRFGAWAGIISGLISSIFGFIFLHEAEAKAFGLISALTGGQKTALFDGFLLYMDPLIYSLPISIVFSIVVTLLTSVKDKAHVDKCFNNI